MILLIGCAVAYYFTTNVVFLAGCVLGLGFVIGKGLSK